MIVNIFSMIGGYWFNVVWGKFFKELWNRRYYRFGFSKYCFGKKKCFLNVVFCFCRCKYMIYMFIN